jgi:polyphenol oxidase
LIDKIIRGFMSHYLTPNWPAPSNVNACTTLRFDGNSQGPYASFNLGRAVDDWEAIIKNRQQLMSELKLPREPLWLKQVHGTTAILADVNTPKGTEADASFTHIPGIVCTVLTADCLPLLFCNLAGTQVAAIHAGWRGLAAGIIEATVHKLQQPSSQWLVWLGPAIGPNVFEVGDEVRTQFTDRDPAAQVAFKTSPNGKWLADIFLLAKQRLKKCGINQIYGGEFCTYSDPNRFYSYRRDQEKTGGMASLIWLGSVKE